MTGIARDDALREGRTRRRSQLFEKDSGDENRALCARACIPTYVCVRAS